jgi:hypothetical protein
MNSRSITTLLLAVFAGTAAGLASCGGGESPGQPAQPTQPSPKPRVVSVTTGRVIADTITAIASIVVDVRDSLTGAPRAGVEVRFVVLDNVPGYSDAAIEVARGGFGYTAVDTTNSLGQVSVRLHLGTFVGTRRVVATAAALAAADTATATVKPGAPTQVRGVPRDTVVILGGQYLQGAEALDRANNVVGPVPATLTTTTPSICSVASDGTVRGVGYGVCLLTVSGAGASKAVQPRVVPSGRILVRRGTAIGTLSLDGSGFTKITDVDTIITRNVQWLASGREIAFWESVDNGHTRLVVSDMQGTERRMPPLPYPASPRRLSGDGAWLLIALLDTNDYLASTGVARMRSDGSSAATVLDKCCVAFAVHADLSVDGSKFAFADALSGLGYYVNMTAFKSNFIGESQSLRFSQDGTQIVRVILNGALIGQDAGDVASPAHDIVGGPGRSFSQTAGWSPDSKWILAAGGVIWWVVPSAGGSAAVLMLPISIGSTYVVLDGWQP